MAELTVTEARSERDYEDVRSLCNGLLDWLRVRYAHESWSIDRYYAPDKWAAVMADLPRLHAPPNGDILIARLNAAPVGCVMLQKLDETTCEMKRLFVPPEARGHGVGRKLCERLMILAAGRGYRTMRLDTGIHHDEAIALYRSLGFRMRSPYYDFPQDMAHLLHFMEADLPAAKGLMEGAR